MDFSFADFEVRDDSERLYPAPSSSTEGEHENAPDLLGRGRSLYLEHETGLAGGLCPRCAAEQSSAANRRPPRWQGDAGVDFIEVFN
jgi:hypothetical protein